MFPTQIFKHKLMLPPNKLLELLQQSEIWTTTCRTDHVCPYANDPCPQQQVREPKSKADRKKDRVAKDRVADEDLSLYTTQCHQAY